MAFRSKDLFEDSTMSFGDHLEELRYYLIRALLGLVLVCLFTLAYGNQLMAVARAPIDRALIRHGLIEYQVDDLGDKNFMDHFVEWSNNLQKGDLTGSTSGKDEHGNPLKTAHMKGDQVEIEVPANDLLAALHQAAPEQFPKPAETAPDAASKNVSLKIQAPEFSIFRDYVIKSNRPVTLNVQEAFMTYLKVALVCGLIFSSPWIFYNVWMFVAVGLYEHERKFVYFYGLLSLVLFLSGAAFCFYLVFPFVLEFLLGFNSWLEVQPQIRLSEWVSFAVLLPLMFGISFQLPLVMVFLTRLGIVETRLYTEQWRIAVLVIAFVSMMLTPADPASMTLMMLPLLFLYGLGIWLCKFTSTDNPFGDESEPALN